MQSFAVFTSHAACPRCCGFIEEEEMSQDQLVRTVVSAAARGFTVRVADDQIQVECVECRGTSQRVTRRLLVPLTGSGREARRGSPLASRTTARV